MKVKKPFKQKIMDTLYTVLPAFNTEKIHPRAVTRLETINGKKIEVKISTYYFKEYNKRIIRKLYHLKKDKLEKLREFLIINWDDLFTNIVFNAFFGAARYYIDLIQVNHLQIDVEAEAGFAYARFMDTSSSKDHAVFAFHPPYIVAKVLQECAKSGDEILDIFTGLNYSFLDHDMSLLGSNIDAIWPKFGNGQANLKVRIKDVIRHEFIHYIDLAKLQSGAKVASAMINSLNITTGIGLPSPIENLPSGLPYSIGRLRNEGIANFGEFRFDYQPYELEEVHYFRNHIKHYTGGLILEERDRSYFTIGGYMCYFISLGIYIKSSKTAFNSLKVCFDEHCNDFIFFTEGFPKIFEMALSKSVKKLYFQKPPQPIIMETLRQLRELEHLKFIRLYEKSCQIIELPEDQIVMTIPVYNQLKQKAHEYWAEHQKSEK